MARLKVLIITFLFIIPVQDNLFCQERTPEILVTVYEGEVSCIKYPDWLLKEVAKGEIPEY